ncbi:glutamate racemase [Sphingobium phenoxybenzoativorans]|uniref:Glutamate racemase n=1 Tax=Sphingobium phenoxybenzoativorans TaxID=1592790 RepID=A0A975K4K9_9SPHN|nr:glutamate racemase [Sphingobium phenoxybenzoativorans]QUT04279.1 glutamate racemase [Sphingobium phenoxybenzoativorans]
MSVPENAPLLFFDSGVGGLSILGPARETLPNAPIVYAADRAGFPYGTKSEAEIAARVPALLGRLVERYRPRLAVIACNTASTIALAAVRSALDIPVVGTVPAIKPAALQSKSRVIGVLGTDATVRQPYVDRLAAEHGADCIILRHGSAALVALAEAKLRGEPLDPAVARDALAGLFDQPGGDRMDVVVLACTHFPLVQPELEAASLRPLVFTHGGPGIARRIAYLTQGQSWPAARQEGIAVFTRLDPDVEALRPALMDYGLTRIEGL